MVTSFLAIDVGNTRLKWAQYAVAQPHATVLAQGAVFLENIEQLSDAAWGALAVPGSVLGCHVAGEAVRRRVEEQLELWDVEPRWVVPSAQAGGVVNGYEHPVRLGADRWTALVGARHRAQAEGEARPILVVMIGTAVTVDALDTTGRFIGGFIMPGFGLMLRSLEMGTAGLKAPSGNAVDFPTNTSDALMSGGAHAIAGAVERVYRKLMLRTGREPLVLLSGGAAVKLAPIIDIKYEAAETLIFEGLLVLQAQHMSKR